MTFDLCCDLQLVLHCVMSSYFIIYMDYVDKSNIYGYCCLSCEFITTHADYVEVTPVPGSFVCLFWSIKDSLYINFVITDKLPNFIPFIPFKRSVHHVQ